VNEAFEFRTQHLQGVYLRDLEERVINDTVVIPARSRDLFRRDSFALFLKHSYNHTWFSRTNSLRSQELELIAKHLRFLRLNLVKSFRLLNDFEQTIIEAEYINWMTDQIAGCWANEARLRKVLENARTADADGNFENETAQIGKLGSACRALSADLNAFLSRSLH
jgi:hypothetical protein